jgi:hypothetical protein
MSHCKENGSVHGLLSASALGLWLCIQHGCVLGISCFLNRASKTASRPPPQRRAHVDINKVLEQLCLTQQVRVSFHRIRHLCRFSENAAEKQATETHFRLVHLLPLYLQFSLLGFPFLLLLPSFGGLLHFGHFRGGRTVGVFLSFEPFVNR